MLKRLFYFIIALVMVLAAAAEIPARDQAAAPATQYARVNGVKLGYRVIGSGPPLLLITGYGATMDSWDHVLVEKLAENFKVIVFDNRGMGYSTINDDALTIRLMADDAAGLLDAVGVADAAVMGWSMGSMIAQEVALNHSGKAAKLVLYASACTNDEAQKALAHVAEIQARPPAERYFPAQWFKQNPDILQRMPRSSIPPSAATAARQQEACLQWPGTKDRLAKLDIPVLMVVGEQDEITPPSQSVQMAGLIPGAWMARFKGGSHFLQYQNPEDFARVVAAFLSTRQDLVDQAK